jgi:hypothetical protein
MSRGLGSDRLGGQSHWSGCRAPSIPVGGVEEPAVRDRARVKTVNENARLVGALWLLVAIIESEFARQNSGCNSSGHSPRGSSVNMDKTARESQMT